MRRANRTGTITKLSGKRRNPYIAKYQTGIDEFGNRIWTIVGYYRTKTEASEALLKFVANPDPMSVSQITFKQAYEELARSRFSTLTDGTQKVYKAAFNRCQPIFNVPIRKLKTADYQRVLDNIAHLKKNTGLLVKSVMVSVCKYGVENDIIQKNYASFAVVKGEDKSPKQIFTDEEIDKLFADGSQIAKELLILIFSGMRVSEYLNLTKDNVHLQEHYVIGGIKTEAGKGRIIPIHDKVYPFWNELFNSADSKISRFNLHTFRWHLIRLEERLGMEYKSPHCARHTCASLMARSGIDPIYIKTILGHTDYAFTVNVYTHANAKQLIKALNEMK